MYRTHQMEQALVPELDQESSQHQNRLHFLYELLPLLESIRASHSEDYQELLESYQNSWPSQSRGNFEALLEYSLTHLNSAYGIQFRLEIGPDSIAFESVECPLVALQELRGGATEIQRKVLCWHCSEFHFRKFFRLFRLKDRLTLYPDACQFEVERPSSEERFNPLYY